MKNKLIFLLFTIAAILLIIVCRIYRSDSSEIVSLKEIDHIINSEISNGWNYKEILGIKEPSLTYLWMKMSGKTTVYWVDQGMQYEKYYSDENMQYLSYTFIKENNDIFVIVFESPQ